MTDVVKSVVEALESEIKAAVTDLKKLDYVIDPERQFQNSRANKNRFGVFPTGMAAESPISQYYVVNQDFRIQLLREYVNRDASDKSQRDVTYSLYDNLSTIIKRLHKTKANCPGIILDVRFTDAAEVEFLESSDVAILEATFLVKYHEALS
jgi:hypothetical protein